MDKVATLRWEAATVAQARMDNLLSANYADDTSTACSRPMTASHRHPLVAQGRRLRPGDLPMPIVTGQDAEVPSVKSIIAGEQYSTDLQGHPRAGQGDRRHGRRRAHRQAARGQRHQDLQQRGQGRAVLPAPARGVDKDNYQKVLVDSGYYKAKTKQ